MDDLKNLVATGCRVLAAADQGDLVWGHLSARDPEGRGVWMKASTFGFEEVTPERVVLVSPEGEVLEGEGRRHAEYPIHTELMATRDDVNAVVHAHSRSGIAVAATGLPLEPLSHEATLFVPPDIARFTYTGDLILTRELGRELARSVGDRNAALMVNHGVVVTGADIPSAVVSTILLEAACRMQLSVLAAGGARHRSSDEEALSKRQNCYNPTLLNQAWEYLVRRLD